MYAMYLRCAVRLLKRKALIEGTEAYFDISDRKPSSFVADISKSTARNNKLREVAYLVSYLL